MSNYYENEMSGFRRAGQNIATALTRKPRLDAMARDEYFKNLALAQNTAAGTRNLTLEGDQKAEQLAAAQKLSQALMAGMEETSSGDYVIKRDAVNNVMAQLPMMSKDASDFGGGFEKVLGAQNKPRQESAKLATALAVGKQRVDAQSGRPIVLSPGAGMYDPKTGNRIATQPGLEHGGVDFETVIEPEVKPQDAIPGAKHWFKADEPDIPAVPGKPKRIIKRRIATGSDLTSALTQGQQDEGFDDQSGESGETETQSAFPTTLAVAKPQDPAAIPAGHIKYLLDNPTPETVADFEEKYGPGSSAQYIKNGK